MANPILLLLTSGLVAGSRPAPAALERLADALGRTHALHRVCAGPSDDLWRARMQAMLQVEPATPGRRARLIGDFNLAYAEAAEAFTTCSPRARAVLRAAARAGATAALRLAQQEGP